MRRRHYSPAAILPVLDDAAACAEPAAKKPKQEASTCAVATSHVAILPHVDNNGAACAEPQVKRARRVQAAKTLAVYVLQWADLQCWKGQGENDTEEDCIARTAKLIPFMEDFVTHVRLEEGFLSRAQIHQSSAGLNEHNRIQHELGKARAAQQMTQGRQSRFAAWSSFTAATVKKFIHDSGATDKQALASARTSGLSAWEARTLTIPARSSQSAQRRCPKRSLP